MAKKKTTKKKTTKRTKPAQSADSAEGKKLVIVESPAKARTINRYLGPDFIVKASVGHVRDLPSKAKKGDKSPVPGVDLEHNFQPTYEVLPGKSKTVSDLKRVAKNASEIWFATDLDREGEAIAWHLANILGIDPSAAKRVVFNAITKDEIKRAFSHPHAIDSRKVDAQQARRILDRIVGYQVSPLLWKKVARGLSAGRVQSVAVRLVVEREREILAFIPDENWKVSARFAIDTDTAPALIDGWKQLMSARDDRGNQPTVRTQNAWLAEHKALRAELVEVGGKPFDISQTATQDPADLAPDVQTIAQLAGLTSIEATLTEDDKGKGPARFRREITGTPDPKTPYKISSIETRKTTSRPGPPFITSTLQQAASSRLSFQAQRTMRVAQRLYEGVDIKGEGSVGLITYMRTDSTHLSKEAVDAARDYIHREFGDPYLPQSPNKFSSSNKAAQEAHEAIRPTSLAYPPDRVRSALGDDEYKVYKLIWDRFLSCQMMPAKWDSTTVLITGGTDPKTPVTFKATGRVLAFDGFYRVSGVPTASDDLTLPKVETEQPLAPFSIEPEQKFSSPPPRYSEASLIKTLEAEGIGRPSTYASIIQVIQDRKYVEQIDRRFYATDLGQVVTDKLIEAFPRIMELNYTRRLEEELDKIEEEHKDWVAVLSEFYERFSKRLERAHEDLVHAKAEIQPAPKEYRCEKCDADLVYRFGKNGRFLSCSNYPDCNYACPIDREGRPRPAEFVNVRCPKTGRAMVRRSGRFGPFLSTILEDGEAQDVGMILNIDKKGKVTAPSPPPLETDLTCPKCDAPLYLREGARGPWLGCSRFPKCRGRGKWAEVPEDQRATLEKRLGEHLVEHPIPIIRTLDGHPLTDEKGKPLDTAPTVDELLIDDPRSLAASA